MADQAVIERMAAAQWDANDWNARWEKINDEMKAEACHSMRAAIETMMEPTKTVLLAGAQAAAMARHLSLSELQADHIYQAMLKAILQEQS